MLHKIHLKIGYKTFISLHYSTVVFFFNFSQSA